MILCLKTLPTLNQARSGKKWKWLQSYIFILMHSLTTCCRFGAYMRPHSGWALTLSGCTYMALDKDSDLPNSWHLDPLKVLRHDGGKGLRRHLPVSSLALALSLAAVVLRSLSRFTGYTESSGSHRLLLLLIKSREQEAGTLWSYAAYVYGHIQPLRWRRWQWPARDHQGRGKGLHCAIMLHGEGKFNIFFYFN